MKLSIIIVNYNAKAFLDICLQSVKKAVKDLEAEVFVVDNTSSDGSQAMIRAKHPWVTLIANKENLGFSKANNQAILITKGDFIIIQNPDTIVAEDSYAKCINFLEENNHAGAVGVKMLDGSGIFLPESKRGLPTPSTAFYKAFGFAKLFPKSRLFSKYYLGHLSPSQNCKSEILAGAFMCVKKETFDKAGLFDEDFFMFGEDIDLSYRFVKSGYENWYLADVPIIHFKGESSKKTDEKYLNSFFGAMDIFYDKHFSNKNKSLLRHFVTFGIFLKRLLYSKNAKQAEQKKTSFPKLAYLPKGSEEQKTSVEKLLQGKSVINRSDSLKTIPKTAEAGVIFSKEIAYKDTLDFMQKHQETFSYFFLSEDNDFLLGSPKSDQAGMVLTK